MRLSGGILSALAVDEVELVVGDRLDHDGACESAHSAYAAQSSILSLGTRSNSRTFRVTSVAPRRRAWAAINVS